MKSPYLSLVEMSLLSSTMEIVDLMEKSKLYQQMTAKTDLNCSVRELTIDWS